MKFYITPILEIITVFLILLGLLISPTITYISLLPLLISVFLNIYKFGEYNQ